MSGKDIVNALNKKIGSGGSFVWSWYGGGTGWAWCNATVCWAFAQTNQKNLYYGGKKVSYCPTSIVWCRANLAQIPIELADAGDVIYFDWDMNGNPNHIGFIRARSTHDVAFCIEGNAGSPSKVRTMNRPKKYVQGVFRPHYPVAKPKTYELTVDGKVQHCTIYSLQHILKIKETGILTKDTVKAIQNIVGATADGAWGDKTSKAFQKYLRKKGTYSGEIDGDFGVNSQKAVQKWINNVIKPVAKPKQTATETTEKKTYTGEWPTFLISKTREQVINDAIVWARYIANDNSFHYGSGSAAHHNGCYFCKTQPSSKTHSNIKDVQKTYCCNPYIHAAFAHGGLIDSMLRMCKKGSSFGFKSSEGYAKSSLFKAIKHPDKSTLKKGDVMCSNSHVAMVTSDGGKTLVEAIHDDNKRNSNKWNGSIAEKEMSKSKYNSFSRVYRLKNGYTNFKHSIQHGDVSDDVAKLQKFLKWYGVYTGSIDRICGDATYTAIKKFQKAEGLKVTGTFGNVNLAKAKKVKK